MGHIYYFGNRKVAFTWSGNRPISISIQTSLRRSYSKCSLKRRKQKKRKNRIHNISNSEYLVRNAVQAALQSNKRLKAKHLLNIFGLAWPWDPRGPWTYSRFVQSPRMIDLCMEDCPILMIFSYFSWKWRWRPSQD